MDSPQLKLLITKFMDLLKRLHLLDACSEKLLFQKDSMCLDKSQMGGACTYDEQCLNGTVCTSKMCKCAQGSSPYKDRCLSRASDQTNLHTFPFQTTSTSASLPDNQWSPQITPWSNVPNKSVRNRLHVSTQKWSGPTCAVLVLRWQWVKLLQWPPGNP